MINYTKFGDGLERVMVVHGWKTDHRCWDAMLSSLDPHAFTYVFVDQRGYGKSIDMEGPYTVPQVAKDMLALADSLDWLKFHVIGHSMGGKVIQRIMADEPGRIMSAIAVTPCPAAPIPFDDETWDLFAHADEKMQNRTNIFRYSTANRLTDTWYQAITEQSIKSSNAKAFAAYLDSWVNYDLIEDIMGNPVPIKVIVGEHDPDLTVDVMQATYGQWLQNTEIVELANCGHYPMLETPLRLAAEWEEFLKAQSL